MPDEGWKRHLDYYWEPDKIRNVMNELPGLRLQAEREQRQYKISYTVTSSSKAPDVHSIKRHLRHHQLRVNVIYSHGAYVDLLPIRASKGLAVRYLAFKWGLNSEYILVGGDSGNDEDMLQGDVLGVVVGNHSEELEALRDRERIYFARREYAGGLVEGIEHYHFLKDSRVEEKE